jgi:hypothetical protein
MRRRIKTSILWLLLIAVPIYGFASVTMLCCDLSHHASATADGPDARHAEHAIHNLDDDAAPLTATHHHNDGHANDADPRPTCSGYMSCCGCASVVSVSSDFQVLFSGTSRPVSFASITHFRLTSDVPDRPPQRLLA